MMTTSNSTPTKLRRIGIATAGALAAVCLVGAGSASAASAAPAETAPADAEAASEEKVASEWRIKSGGQAIIDEFGLEFMHAIQGGHIYADGTGYIELNGTDNIEIVNARVLGDMLMIHATYTGYLGTTTTYAGLLDAVMPGMHIYEGELEDMVFGNEINFEFPGLMLDPVY